jgi:hypothetical protein
VSRWLEVWRATGLRSDSTPSQRLPTASNTQALVTVSANSSFRYKYVVVDEHVREVIPKTQPCVATPVPNLICNTCGADTRMGALPAPRDNSDSWNLPDSWLMSQLDVQRQESSSRTLRLPADLADDAVVDITDEWLVRIFKVPRRMAALQH